MCSSLTCCLRLHSICTLHLLYRSVFTYHSPNCALCSQTVHPAFAYHLFSCLFVHRSSGKVKKCQLNAFYLRSFSRRFLPIDVSSYLIIFLQEHGHLSHFFRPWLSSTQSLVCERGEKKWMASLAAQSVSLLFCSDSCFSTWSPLLASGIKVISDF